MATRLNDFPGRDGDALRAASLDADLYPINPATILEIRQVNIAHGWHENVTGDRSNSFEFPAFMSMAHSELSEALEAFRIGQWVGVREDGKPVGVGPELADAIIRIIDTASLYKLDLNKHLRDVMDFNWTRTYRHGGKKI